MLTFLGTNDLLVDTSRDIRPFSPVVKDGFWDVAEELPLGVSIPFETTDSETHVSDHVQSFSEPSFVIKNDDRKKERCLVSVQLLFELKTQSNQSYEDAGPPKGLEEYLRQG